MQVQILAPAGATLLETRSNLPCGHGRVFPDLPQNERKLKP